MKYKCVHDFWKNGVKLMSEGDIIVVSEDGQQLYNITTSCDIRDINSVSEIFPFVVSIFDICNNSIMKTSAFETITSEMYETYKKKNKDYGNSFDKSLDKWGLSVAAIRLGDKLNRFESYVKNGSFAVNDEGVLDTLMDLSCYSIMTIMYLKNKQNGKN